MARSYMMVTEQSRFIASDNNGNRNSILRILTVVLFLAFSVLVVGRDVAGLPVSKYIFIVIGAIICFICDKTELLCFVAFIAPLHEGVSGVYISGFALIAFFIKNKQIRRFNRSHLLIFVLLAMELIVGLHYDFSFVEYVRFAVCFILLFTVSLDTGLEVDAVRVLRFYISGFIIALISVWGQLLRVYSFPQVLSMGARLGNLVESSGAEEGVRVSFNNNDLGFVSMLAVLFCLMLLKKTGKKLYFIPFALSAITSVMTMSRGANIALAIGLILYFLLSAENLKKTARNIILLVLLSVLLIQIIWWLMPNYISSFSERFMEEDISNGRVDIASFYFRALWNNPLGLIFGVGLQKYNAKYDYFYSAHNATQEIVIAWGVLGFLVIVALFARAITITKRNNPKFRLFQAVPLITLFIGLQSGQGFSGYAHMQYLLVCFMAFYLEFDNGGIKKKKHD
ncbi:MAG: O-antigen ligase family protein [Clostridia bacterium]|nr:O-antigen ligase family protein [Clostridia bacterium]